MAYGMLIGRKARVISFANNLLKWYDQMALDLPWRLTKDPYKIYLSEVMLQQTQVQTVIPYYKGWISTYPDCDSVAGDDLESILKQWEGLGYYKRARNFHKACKIICQQYNGKTPTNIQDFADLPGVGSYTAAAVMSIAFQLPVPAVDANVLRIMSRVKILTGSAHRRSAIVQNMLKPLMPPSRSGDFNQAMMDLGRLVCTSNKPKCDVCPIRQFCKAFAKNLVFSFPKKSFKPPKPVYNVAVGVIWDNDKILISKRKNTGLLGGMWEFPGGKMLSGETAESCIVREVKEELGVRVHPAEFITQIKHSYTHFSIILDAYHCKYISGEPYCYQCSDWRWILPEEIPLLPFPKANHKLFPHVFRTRTLC